MCSPSCVEVTYFVHWLVPTSYVEVISFVEFLSGDSENPSHGEGGDVDFGARISKYFLCVHLLSLFFSLNSTLVISYIAIIIHIYVLDDIVYVLTLILYQESY